MVTFWPTITGRQVLPHVNSDAARLLAEVKFDIGGTLKNRTFTPAAIARSMLPPSRGDAGGPGDQIYIQCKPVQGRTTGRVAMVHDDGDPGPAFGEVMKDVGYVVLGAVVVVAATKLYGLAVARLTKGGKSSS